MNHPLGVTGLVLNAIGSLLLIRYGPNVEGYTKDGFRVPEGSPFSEVPSSHYQKEDWRREFKRRQWTFRIAFALLTSGFVLQLFDLLFT